MGTPDYAVPTLRALLDRGVPVVGVVSQPARPKGRGNRVEQTPVGALAEARGLPLFQWPRLSNESYATLQGLAPDLIVVVAYGRILPQRYLDLPPLGCLNGHGSLLPALRGAAPIQWAVIRGLPETGVSIMQMEAGMDTGPVGLMRRTPIGPEETTADLFARLAEVSAAAMVEAVEALCAGALAFTVQDHAQATLAPMLTKEDGRLDWRWPAQKLHDRVRGTWPWPGAFFERDGEPWKVHATRLAEGAGAPGTILAHAPDGPVVACGEGAVVLTRLQRPGRKALDGNVFLLGDPLPPGEVL
ncbi:MAG: methionyl-tRNA formyltransferase [Myxococcales bacterium]|nr:methionyl-tRNA formyltransferase [Myxococcales bacterium]